MLKTVVPLVDLDLQHQQIAEEVRVGFDRVLQSKAFILGPEVEDFEGRFADYCGVRHCIGVANGTDALELALRSCDIGPGDEVIVPANTFVATAEAVLRAGATLVLADCDDSYLMDPESVAQQVSRRTRAIVPVHLYGQIAPMKPLDDVIGDAVFVVEDAAQSHGATQYDQAAGSFGLAAGTSFYPGKNLGAYGDAGAVITNSAEVATRLRALRNHGGLSRYQHEILGFNSRLDDLQAVVLSAKLAKLDRWNEDRRVAAAYYSTLLADTEEITTPTVLPGNEHSWHLYVIRAPRRDEILSSLKAEGISAGIHYPTPVHLLPAYRSLGLKTGSLPKAERFAKDILSLPIFPGITPNQQEHVVSVLQRAVRRRW